MSSFTNILTEAGQGFVKEIQSTLARKKINASGKLSRSVEYKVERKGFTFRLEVSAFQYIFSALQEGRGPSKKGQTPGQLRPRILQWIREKPVDFKKYGFKNPASFAYVVADRIHNEGTKLFRQLGANQTSGELEKIFSDDEIEAIETELIMIAEDNISEGFIKFSGR